MSLRHRTNQAAPCKKKEKTKKKIIFSPFLDKAQAPGDAGTGINARADEPGGSGREGGRGDGVGLGGVENFPPPHSIFPRGN